MRLKTDRLTQPRCTNWLTGWKRVACWPPPSCRRGAAPLLSNRIECYIPRLLGVLFLLLKDIVTDSIALDILKVFTRVKWSERRKLEILRSFEIGENCDQIPKP